MDSSDMVHQANQIAAFFGSYPEDEAVIGVADHFAKFWDPQLRQQLSNYVASDGAGLDALVIRAIRKA